MPELSIAFVSLSSPSSPLSVRSQSLAKHMAALGWRVTYILSERFRSEGYSSDCFEVEYASSTSMQFARDCAAIVRRRRIDWIHFLNPERKALLFALRSRHTKIIGDWEDWHCINRERGWRRWALRSIDAIMRRRCDRVVTCSQWLATKFSALGRSDATYIPYAELPIAMPQAANPYAVPTAVYMGYLHPFFDHSIILEAARILAERNLHPAIEIIGSGEELEASQAFIQTHGLHHIRMAGYIDGPPLLNRLRWAHVLLFPIRLNEQNLARCPFKVFQYAKAQRPILTCAVGEVAAMLGDHAHYIPCEAMAFARELEVYMQQPRLPDINYEIERQTWVDRAAALDRLLRT